MDVIEALLDEGFSEVNYDGRDANHRYFEGIFNNNLYEFKAQESAYEENMTEIYGRLAGMEDWRYMFDVEESI
jgi:hypothetical protein